MRSDDYYALEYKFKQAFSKLEDDDLKGTFVSLQKATNEDKEVLKKAKIELKYDDKFLEVCFFA